MGAQAAFAEVSHTSPQVLRTMGVDPSRFALAAFSPDGRSILGSAPGTTEEVAKGSRLQDFPAVGPLGR